MSETPALSRLTTAELEAYAAENGIDLTGAANNGERIDRIKAALESTPAPQAPASGDVPQDPGNDAPPTEPMIFDLDEPEESGAGDPTEAGLEGYGRDEEP